MFAKMAYERVQLMKNVKGDAIAEVLNTFSYYGRYSKEYTEGSTTYSPYNYTSWFKATYDADGNVTATGEDTLWSYGRSYYNNDFILVGEVYRPFLLRGGHWSNDAYTGVFTSSGYAGGAYDITRFSSSGGVLDVDV